MAIAKGFYADEGLDVDVAYALADELGVDCAFVSVTGLSDAYDACDVVMGVRAGDDADTAVAGSYAEDAMALFSRASSGTKATAADLAGKTVGVQAGSVSQRALASAGTEAAEQDFTNLNEAFAALEAGTVDYSFFVGERRDLCRQFLQWQCGSHCKLEGGVLACSHFFCLVILGEEV